MLSLIRLILSAVPFELQLIHMYNVCNDIVNVKYSSQTGLQEAIRCHRPAGDVAGIPQATMQDRQCVIIGGQQNGPLSSALAYSWLLVKNVR